MTGPPQLRRQTWITVVRTTEKFDDVSNFLEWPSASVFDLVGLSGAEPEAWRWSVFNKRDKTTWTKLSENTYYVCSRIDRAINAIKMYRLPCSYQPTAGVETSSAPVRYLSHLIRCTSE